MLPVCVHGPAYKMRHACCDCRCCWTAGGKRPGCKENEQPPTSTDIRQQLRDHLAGKWRVKYVCSFGCSHGDEASTSSKKAGCPFCLVVDHEAGSDYVHITEVGQTRAPCSVE
jgi:hypothetical protein